MNPWLVLQAIKYLCVAQFVLKVRGFDGLHNHVQSRHTASPRVVSDVNELRRAFLAARRLYLCRLKCLPLGAACALFMRRHGWPVQMVFGVARRPFLAHVWVELHGNVVFGTFDKSRYIVMDRI